jgi:hypothetical protein
MAAIGWRTVVSCGQVILAPGVSSKPATDRVSGRSRRRRLATAITPRAMSSLRGEDGGRTIGAAQQTLGGFEARAEREPALLHPLVAHGQAASAMASMKPLWRRCEAPWSG